MAAGKKGTTLTASAPQGWRWVRASTAAAIVSLLTGALSAIAAVWLKLAEKQTSAVYLLLLTASLAALGFLAAAVGKIAEAKDRKERTDQEWWSQVLRLVREFSNGNLPRLSQLPDTVLGPTPTRHTRGGGAPYVPRPAIDGPLRAALAACGPPYPFVVLVGPSKAGKSRTLTEAARAAHAHSDPAVILPNGGESLAELALLARPLRVDPIPGLVWLDDLTGGDLNHLSGTVLDALSQRFVVMATMTDERWAQVLYSAGDVTAVARDALRRAARFELDFELTPEERSEAARLYPDEWFDASVAETLVGGDQLVARQRAGRAKNPAGYALVQAAIDIRRAGVQRPISKSELRQLYPLYLQRVRIDLDPSTERFEEGLTWAAEPVASQVSLLRRTDAGGEDDGWEVLDYAVAADDGQGGHTPRPMPEELWDELLALVPAEDASDIGTAAYLRNQTEVSIRAFQRATKSAHTNEAARATMTLGVLLKRERDDLEGARVAFEAAIDSGIAEIVPWAMLSLGEVLMMQRDLDGARASYQMAIDSGEAQVAPRAGAVLGPLLALAGDFDGGRAVLQTAIESGHPEAAPMAAYGLGRLLTDHGRPNEAQVAYRLAIDSGHAEAAPEAAAELGLILKKQGDVDGARATYQIAIDSGHGDAAPMAAFRLGWLLADEGDAAGAQAAYQMAIDSGSKLAPDAAGALGRLLREQGDVAGARTAFAFAVGSGDAEVAPLAAVELGQLLLLEEDDRDGAYAAYQTAMESGHADAAPRAAVILGTGLAEQGDVDHAEAAFRVALDSDHSEIAPRAAFALGQLLIARGDRAGAQVAYEKAIASGHADEAPQAALALGVMLAEQGDLTAAREMLQAAVDSGHADAAPLATAVLGDLLAEQGDLTAAREMLQAAVDSGHAGAARVATAALRARLIEQEREAAAEQSAGPSPAGGKR